MDIRQLNYFAACVEAGSMNKAAERLYTSQPSVTHAIRTLEEELGTTLFIRGAHGLTLTEAGKRIYDQAVNAIKAVDVISAVADGSRGSSLSIAATPSSNLAALFAAFCRETGGEHRFSYYEGGAEDIMRKVSAREAELGFVFAADSKSAAFSRALFRLRLDFRPLVSTDMVVFVGPEHPLYGAESITPEELAVLRFVQPIDDFFTLNDVISLPREGGARRAPDCVVRTNSDHAMMRLLADTDLCNLGSYWQREPLRDGCCRLIPVEGYRGKVRFGCLTARGEEPEGLAAAFLKHVESAVSSARPDAGKGI